MKGIKNINIWKEKEDINDSETEFLNSEIALLNLSVRPYNCLKRAGCDTIQDVLNFIGEEGQGLRKLRNLGSKSETEIMEKIEEYRKLCFSSKPDSSKKKVTIIKPAKKIWDREIDEFHLSNYALVRLRACGIQTIRDLYATNPKNEPGWYAVRELFEKIPSGR